MIVRAINVSIDSKVSPGFMIMFILLVWKLLTVFEAVGCICDYPGNFSIVNCTMESGNLSWVANLPLPWDYEGFECTCTVSSLSNLSCEFRASIDYTETHELAVQPECVVYNWNDGMTCSYALENTTNWTIIYSRCYGCGRDYRLFACPNANGTTCWWRPSWIASVDVKSSFFRGEYTVFLYNTFTRRVAVKSKLRFNTDDRVKPNMPGMKYDLGRDNSVTLSWHSPDKFDLMKVNYRLRIKSRSRDRTFNTTSKSFTIGNLEPFTNHTVTVDCIPLSISKPHEVAGYWSRSKMVSFQTYPDVPKKAPLVHRHGFHVIDSNQSIQVVQIFWQPADESNGPIHGYRIRYRKKSTTDVRHEKSVAGSQFSVTLALDCDSDYVVLIDARTSAGYNESLQLEEIFVEKRRSVVLPPATFVVSTDGDNKYFISFHDSLNGSNATMFWCPSSIASPSTCLGAPVWQTILVEANVTASVHLNTTSDPVLWFVSFDDSIGMVPSSCVFNSRKEIETIDEFHFPDEQEPDSLTVKWKSLDRCNNSAYISHYVLAYCQSINCLQFCLEPEQELKIDSHANSYKIPGLEGGKCYLARIKGASMSQIGDQEGEFTTYQRVLVTSRPILSSITITTIVAGTSSMLILLAAAICMTKTIFADITIVPPQKSSSDDRDSGRSSDNLINSGSRSPVDTGEPTASFNFSQHQDINIAPGRQDVRSRGPQDIWTSEFQGSAFSQTSGVATYSTVHQSNPVSNSEPVVYTQTVTSAGTYDQMGNLAVVPSEHPATRLPSLSGYMLNSGAADHSYSGSICTNRSVFDSSSILDLQ